MRRFELHTICPTYVEIYVIKNIQGRNKRKVGYSNPHFMEHITFLYLIGPYSAGPFFPPAPLTPALINATQEKEQWREQ